MLLRFALFLGAGLLPKRKLKGMFCPMRGGFFILQLHDELLYEVAEEDVVQVCCSVYYVGSRWWGSEWPVLCHVRCIGPSLPQAGCINVESLWGEKPSMLNFTLKVRGCLMQTRLSEVSKFWTSHQCRAVWMPGSFLIVFKHNVEQQSGLSFSVGELGNSLWLEGVY